MNGARCSTSGPSRRAFSETWYFEEREQPWPEIATQVEAEVRAAVEPLLREHRDQPTT